MTVQRAKVACVPIWEWGLLSVPGIYWLIFNFCYSRRKMFWSLRSVPVSMFCCMRTLGKMIEDCDGLPHSLYLSWTYIFVHYTCWMDEINWYSVVYLIWFVRLKYIVVLLSTPAPRIVLWVIATCISQATASVTFFVKYNLFIVKSFFLSTRLELVRMLMNTIIIVQNCQAQPCPSLKP